MAPHYTASQLQAGIVFGNALDPVALKRSFVGAVAEARDLLPRLTSEVPETVGCMALGSEGRLVVPDSAAYRHRLVRFHPASVGGAWPEIVGGDMSSS